MYTPLIHGLQIELGLLSRLRLTRLCVRTHHDSQTLQVPRAPLHAQGITFHAGVSRSPSAGVTPPSSLIRTHAPDLIPPIDFGFHYSIGLCRLSSLPAAMGSFPTLSLRIFPYVHGPLPRLLLWCVYPFLPTRHRPSRRHQPVGAWQHAHAMATSACKTFRGCSHSIIFMPVDLLATQVAPTVMPLSIRQPWLLLPRISQFVTSLSRGYANRPFRATDGEGTFTLLDSQPCRLLRCPCFTVFVLLFWMFWLAFG